MFFYINPKNLGNKQSSCRWFRASRRSSNVTVMHDGVGSLDLDVVFVVGHIKPVEKQLSDWWNDDPSRDAIHMRESKDWTVSHHQYLRCRWHSDTLRQDIHGDVIKWKYFPHYFPLWRQSTGHRWIPLTKASDAELWCFLDLRLNKRLSKQPMLRWSKTPSRSLWRHCNEQWYLYNVLGILRWSLEWWAAQSSRCGQLNT